MLGFYSAPRRGGREVVSNAAFFLLGVIGSGPRHWMEFGRYGAPHSFERLASPIMALDLSAIMPNVYRIIADFSGHPDSASWPLALTIPLDRIVAAAVIVFVTACVLSELSRKWSRVEPAILLPAILFAACAVLVGRHAEWREPGVETMEELKRASQGR